MVDVRQVLLGEKVESAVGREELQGEIVFVSSDTGESRSSVRGDIHDAGSRIKVFVRIKNGFAHFACVMRDGVRRQIGAEEASFPVYGVTLRALRFSKEQLLPNLAISRR